MNIDEEYSQTMKAWEAAMANDGLEAARKLREAEELGFEKWLTAMAKGDLKAADWLWEHVKSLGNIRYRSIDEEYSRTMKAMEAAMANDDLEAARKLEDRAYEAWEAAMSNDDLVAADWLWEHVKVLGNISYRSTSRAIWSLAQRDERSE